MSNEITGVRTVLANLDKLDNNLRMAISDSVIETTKEVKRRAVQDIEVTSTGHDAIRYGEPGKRHVVVSRPGDAPNSDTDTLVQSIKRSAIKGQLFGFVFTELKYGLFLETVLNRHWLEPALNKSKGFFKYVM